MNRLSPSWRFLLGLAASAAVYGLSYWTANRFRSTQASPADDLAWLRQEYQLTDAEMARIRVLHEAYKPECEALCARVAEKNRQLRTLVAGATNVGPGIEQKLAEVAALRAECQAHMLRHFHEMARSMPAAQGSRYLEEMQRVALGLQDSMGSGAVARPHEHR